MTSPKEPEVEFMSDEDFKALLADPSRLADIKSVMKITVTEE